MRALFGVGLVFALACGAAAADDKIDAKKLVGKWAVEADKEKKRPPAVVEYTADGKVTVTFTVGEGKEYKIEGTYKVEGNKLTQTAKIKDKETTRTVTVTKLTDDVLEGENDKGEKNSFKRVKK